MILAVAVPEKRELVICAAGSVREHKEFLRQIENNNPELIQDTDFSRFLIDPDLATFKVEPTILEFPDEDTLKGFVDENSIETTNFANAHGRQRRMLELEDFNADTGGRTLAEIHGLVDNDPWDRRTDEEKAEAEKKKKEMSEKAKSGDITGDSWGAGGKRSMTSDKGESQPTVDATPDKTDPNATGGATGGDDPTEDQAGGLRIRDMKITVNEDGSIDIGDILADKDLFAPDMYHLTILNNGEPSKIIEDYDPILKRAGISDNGRYLGAQFDKHEDGGIVIQLGGAATLRMKEALQESGREYTLVATITEKEGYGDDNVYKIADDQLVATYFRADALDRSVAQVNTMIEANVGAKTPYRARDLNDGGSWHAYIRRSDAEKTVEILLATGAKAELNEVDHLGVRIIEEGTEDAIVLDREAKNVEPPAPWNDRRDEFYALDEEGQKKAFQKLLPFLLYSLRDYGDPYRIIAHITPKTYFNEHGKLWEGELPLEGVLPDNFTKFGDKVGVYQIKSLDLNTTDFILGNKAKMRESLMLRAHLNSLGNDAQ